jgi:cellulose synthase/poly-beta-1,6-N-acetylglucosamine synthase-like glycosyltransferase
MQIFSIITLTLLVLYIIRISHYLAGWRQITEFKPNNSLHEILISIIIPFRNEEKNIKGLLKDLANQTYPEGLFEVIFVNDHSEDLTTQIIKPFCSNHKNFRLIQLQENFYGKKEALETGIRDATGELIVTTDADCRAGNKWISTIAAYYVEYNKPEMIIGLVDMKSGSTLYSKFQQLEFLSLIGSGAGAVGISQPIFCSGANLIYKKEVFDKYKDPLIKKHVSGDDTLFMLKLKSEARHEIKLLKSKEAIVYTQPQITIGKFVQQRIRWTSKAKFYKDYNIIYSSVIVLTLNVSILISMILIFTNKYYSLYPVLIFGKTLIDFIFMNSVLKFFNKKRLLKFLILFQVFYPLYISIIGILGNFAGYRWKNRNTKKYL